MVEDESRQERRYFQIVYDPHPQILVCVLLGTYLGICTNKSVPPGYVEVGRKKRKLKNLLFKDILHKLFSFMLLILNEYLS